MAATNSKKEIQVYAHWLGLQAFANGFIVRYSIEKEKTFSFEYERIVAIRLFPNDRSRPATLFRAYYHGMINQVWCFPGFMSGQVGKSIDATKGSCYRKTGGQGCKNCGIQIFIDI